jgi:hypothetical protein
MNTVVSKDRPQANSGQQSQDLDQLQASRSHYYFDSLKDALRSLPTISPKGSIVVLLGVPDDTKNQTLNELNSEIKDGKMIWSVINALREVISHSPNPFRAAEKFIINNYKSLLGGPNREVFFQETLAMRCGQSPAFVLTSDWPDPTTLGKGLKPSPFKFLWATGFFTIDLEVLCIRCDTTTNTYEVGRGILNPDGPEPGYEFSELPPPNSSQ